MRGHVEQRSKGVWRIWVDAGHDPRTNKRRRITKTVHGTRDDADTELAKTIVAVRANRRDAIPATLGDLIDRWLEHAEPRLSVWTARGYRSKIETHIRPGLGNVKLKNLTTARLDRFYSALHEHGLSAQTVRHIHAIIRRALGQGVRWEWLDRNVAERAEPPPVDGRTGRAPTPADIVTVLGRLDRDMLTFAFTIVVTGARRGEVCGLRWSDITFHDHPDDHPAYGTGRVTIARAVADPPSGVVIKSTKTGKERNVAIGAMTVALLKSHKARQAAAALAADCTPDPDPYVFASDPAGAEPLRPQLATKRWANAAAPKPATKKRPAVPAVNARLHDARHFAITELLDAGFDVSGVSARAGHASAKMTLDQYGHTRRPQDLAAAEHLEQLVRAAVE